MVLYDHEGGASCFGGQQMLFMRRKHQCKYAADGKEGATRRFQLDFCHWIQDASRLVETDIHRSRGCTELQFIASFLAPVLPAPPSSCAPKYHLSFSYQAPLVIPLAHSFPQLFGIGEVRVDGKAVDRIAQSTNTPLVEKEKKQQQKDHRYAMHVRQGCINFELGSRQCFSQCCQGVREWCPCSHALLVLGLPSFSLVPANAGPQFFIFLPFSIHAPILKLMAYFFLIPI